jgi:hypothetical protein
MIHWKERMRASGIHLSLSLLVASFAALLVFAVWYPYPYRDLSGGRELFLLVVAVDVVLGPLITLAIFSRRKPWTELRRDLAMVGLIQLSALGYGLWTVALARPVHLVFEVDRFRVVHAVEVPEQLLEHSLPQIKPKPWLGPTMLAVREFRNSREGYDATIAALQGTPLAVRPDLWQPYGEARDRVLQAAKPVSLLSSRFGSQRAEIDKVLQASGRSPDALAYLPLVGRKSFWTALIDRRTADVVAFLPLDSF